MAKLYVVGTPIGNLEDITLRALNVLKNVDTILCEDTRTTKNLLDHYAISTKTMSYHANSSLHKHEEIVTMLREGKDLALVSDAGTPAISDPGVMLIAQAKQELGDVLEVVAIPGPSALVSALSISGVPASEFTFLGFLPHKKGRQTLFQEIAQSERVMVFYESPHRIEKTIESLKEFAPMKRITIARELTKMFEQTISGSPEEIAQYFSKNQDKVRGEFVVIVSPR